MQVEICKVLGGAFFGKVIFRRLVEAAATLGRAAVEADAALR